MGLWFPWLEWSLFLLVTEACEVPILMARFPLTLLGWTLETFNVIWISNSSDISPCSCKHSWHQSFSCNGFACHLYHSCDWVVYASQRIFSSCACLLGGLYVGASLNWWATWGSLATCLMCLAVTFELSIFFATCLILLVGNLSRSMLPSLIVFETNSSSFKKNQKMSLWMILAVSGGYLAKATWVCTALYHSSTDLFPCKKLVSKSNLALTSLY